VLGCLRAFGTTIACLPPATLTPHRPGSRISTAPARWPVDQPKCPDPAGQTGDNGPTSARLARPAPPVATAAPACPARSVPADYRNTAIYRTRR